MVTFDTDFWTPAMDEKRRLSGQASVRQRRGDERVTPDEEGNHPLQYLNHVEAAMPPTPSTPTHLLETSSGNVSDEGYKSASPRNPLNPFAPPMIVGEDGHQTPPIVPPGNSFPAKRPSLFTRLLHSPLMSPQYASPPVSPMGDVRDDGSPHPKKDDVKDGLHAPTPVNPARKHTIRDMLNRRPSFYGKDGKGSGSRPMSPAADEIPGLAKKYGVCDRESIGEGATAVVRLAHKLEAATNSEHFYAVKEFRRRRKDETEREYVKKLAAEFCISSTLQHVNVIRTVDLVQDENQIWCEVMEYCPGGDLYNAIKSGCMTNSEIDCCFKQLIIGVSYLHSMGVAHRDIKPENLLLDANGHLKLTDFGVSEVFRMCWEKSPHLSKPGVLGSEPYMAPELFQSVSYDAREVDVWACGIVYYCMIYHGIPWRRATASDANYSAYLEQRGGSGYEPMQRLRGGCRSLLKRVLDPDPATRITVPEILEDPWFCSIRCCSAESESFMRSVSPPKAADQDGSAPPRPLNTSLVAREVHHHVPDDVLAAHYSRSRRWQQSASPV